MERSNSKITPFGGTLLISDMIASLGLASEIDSRIPCWNMNRAYKPSEMIIGTASMCKSYNRIDPLSSLKLTPYFKTN